MILLRQITHQDHHIIERFCGQMSSLRSSGQVFPSVVIICILFSLHRCVCNQFSAVQSLSSVRLFAIP